MAGSELPTFNNWFCTETKFTGNRMGKRKKSRVPADDEDLQDDTPHPHRSSSDGDRSLYEVRFLFALSCLFFLLACNNEWCMWRGLSDACPWMYSWFPIFPGGSCPVIRRFQLRWWNVDYTLLRCLSDSAFDDDCCPAKSSEKFVLWCLLELSYIWLVFMWNLRSHKQF